MRAFAELTTREEEILTLNTWGRSNKEIAELLFISLKTVGNHVSNIFIKLQVADRALAVIRARGAGSRRRESCRGRRPYFLLLPRSGLSVGPLSLAVLGASGGGSGGVPAIARASSCAFWLASPLDLIPK